MGGWGGPGTPPTLHPIRHLPRSRPILFHDYGVHLWLYSPLNNFRTFIFEINKFLQFGRVVYWFRRKGIGLLECTDSLIIADHINGNIFCSSKSNVRRVSFVHSLIVFLKFLRILVP